MKKVAISRKQRNNLIRILVAIGLFAIIFIVDKVISLDSVFKSEYAWLFPFALYLVVYYII